MRTIKHKVTHIQDLQLIHGIGQLNTSLITAIKLGQRQLLALTNCLRRL